MIVKSFEFNKINLEQKKYFLLYGENEGLKDEIIKKIEPKYFKNIFRYDEKEVLENKDDFFNGILSKSLFEKEKLIIINRASDKIKTVVEEIIEKEVNDITFILIAGMLDKRSKLRNLFEKNKEIICIPFYADTHQVLSVITSNYFKDKKISISQEMMNLIIDRCRGSRQNLNNELIKIENYCRNKKKVNIEEILKLTNLSENYNISELTDTCLLKNSKKTAKILNENIISTEDLIVIVRTFLIKSKRLLKLKKEIKKNINIDAVITNFKPPIFWKDKDVIKQQLLQWSLKELINLIANINDVELLVKKNSSNSINILSDFIINKSNRINN